ncbi:MAG: hypothetical protein MUC29_01530 [Pyrinomonadaceae bacterium]|nr:hypothetical protein [Pyrinomonadaceae bacterium]
MSETKENQDFEETETAQEVAPTVEEESKELKELRWSVITFENCAVKGLTYNEALNWREKLFNQGLSGLCIVTDEAAERVEK